MTDMDSYAALSGLIDTFGIKRRVSQRELLHPALISCGLSGLSER